jgi:hypothetical protein
MNDAELEKLAQQAELEARGRFSRRIRSIEDFRYDEVQEKYWDMTTGTLLGAKSVDGAIPRAHWPTVAGAEGKVVPIKPSVAINDIMTGLTVEGATWWPGKPQLIENVVVVERGAMEKEGAITYNTYVAPDWSHLEKKKLPKPDKWIAHVKKLWPNKVEHEHFFNWGAHMIQKPYEKVNHGLVLAGKQGIGKDTALHPLRIGVGLWNSSEITPDNMVSQHNGFVKSVLLIVNEVRPHDDDFKASTFYDMMKIYLAAPPDMLPMDLKYHNIIHVRNVCHVGLTCNDPLKMYIPREDRRLFVMTSDLPDPKEHPVFVPGYFEDMWSWMANGGAESVVKWLHKRPISAFNSAAPPPMTPGKLAIIESADQVRRSPIDDLFEFYSEHNYGGKPPEVFFAKDLLDFVNAQSYFDDKNTIVKLLNAKNFHFKMDDRGYVMVKNPTGSEWKNGNYRSRAAFVLKGVLPQGRVSSVLKELQKRPLTFKF